MNEGELELQMAGYHKVYDYTQYSHENHINVIPESDFKRLITDTFKIIADNLRRTYGPYGSSVMMTDQSLTTTTKDGFNAFEGLHFNHPYKRMVYLAIYDIIKRVNRNVGDGTTTCILLAEKIFNNINDIIKTPDDKRLILEILTDIEKDLQNSKVIKNDRTDGRIKRLTAHSLKRLIDVADNYDEELTNVIYDALDAKIYDGNVISVRNIVSDEDVSLDAESSAVYDISYMPGDYRVRVNISTDDAIELSQITELRVVIYDHAFDSADWKKFMKNWDNVPTLILARAVTHGVMRQEWVDYCKQVAFAKKCGQGDGNRNLYIAEIKGDFVQHEIQDLAEVIGTQAHAMYDLEIDHSEVPTVKLQIYKGNCLAIYDVIGRDHSEYIKKLEYELENDKSHSYVKEKETRNRIKALRMTSHDTMLTVKCGTRLEAKLIMDKIDDCISIVNSAVNSGIVPNLLNYAFYRIFNFYNEGTLRHRVAVAINDSITGLFEDMWKSKYGNQYEEESLKSAMGKFYSQHTESYDIISSRQVSMEDFPTSAQYDLEVVVAALSIVKYLLTSRALIFDAHLLPQVNDEGHYVP